MWRCVNAMQCGYSLQPRLTLMPPDGVNLASVIWRDNSNTTFATGVLTAQLPPLSSLLERSATASDRCNQNCDWSYHIKAMADNGAQTLLDVTIAAVLVDKVMLRVRYTYYLRDRVMQALETHTIPVWLAGSGYAGQLLSASPVELGTSVQVRAQQSWCWRVWALAPSAPQAEEAHTVCVGGGGGMQHKLKDTAYSTGHLLAPALHKDQQAKP